MNAWCSRSAWLPSRLSRYVFSLVQPLTQRDQVPAAELDDRLVRPERLLGSARSPSPVHRRARQQVLAHVVQLPSSLAMRPRHVRAALTEERPTMTC